MVVPLGRHPGHERGDAVGYRLPHGRREELGADLVGRGGGEAFGLLLLRLAAGGRREKAQGCDHRDRQEGAQHRLCSDHV